MKQTIKICIPVFISVFFFSCTKENMQKPAVANNTLESATATFVIGQSYGGGIIFYIDTSGKHGLIAAKGDQGQGITWWNGTYVTTGATGVGIGTGAKNTKKIIAAQGNTGSYAALLCTQFTGGNHNDWYLPSQKELDLLYKQRSVVGHFAKTNYWSSTEVSWDNTLACDEVFQTGGFQFNDDKGFSYNVRAIRSF